MLVVLLFNIPPSFDETATACGTTVLFVMSLELNVTSPDSSVTSSVLCVTSLEINFCAFAWLLMSLAAELFSLCTIFTYMFLLIMSFLFNTFLKTLLSKTVEMLKTLFFVV